jgi:hypothetical protein
VIAIVTVVALVAGLSPSRQPANSGPAPAARPRFYVTVVDASERRGVKVEAVVRASANGQVTGTVTVPSLGVDPETFVTAAADDRSFILSTYHDQSPDNVGGGFDVRLFRFGISADGKPGHLTELMPPSLVALRFPPTASCSRSH